MWNWRTLPCPFRSWIPSSSADASVTKPEKGTMASFSGYGEAVMGGMMRGMGGGAMGGRGRMGAGMMGYGGMASNYGAAMSKMMGQQRGMQEAMMRLDWAECPEQVQQRAAAQGYRQAEHRPQQDRAEEKTNRRSRQGPLSL